MKKILNIALKYQHIMEKISQIMLFEELTVSTYK